MSQCGGTFMTLDLFPSVIDHLGFSSVSSLWASLFNLEYSETSARLIMGELFPGAVMEGTAGVMNSLFIAEAWANFGWYGLIISPIYVGFIIQSLFLFFLKSPKTPFFLAFFVYYSARSSLTGGFNAYIYNPQVLLFLGLIILFNGMVRLMVIVGMWVNEMKMGNKICKFFFFFCCIVGIFSCSKDNEKPEIVTVSRTPDYLSVDEVLDILGTNRRKAYLNYDFTDKCVEDVYAAESYLGYFVRDIALLYQFTGEERAKLIVEHTLHVIVKKYNYKGRIMHPFNENCWGTRCFWT